jgi:hypothetical protein
VHEGLETVSGETIVEGFVRHPDAVLVVEGPEQVCERFHLGAAQRRDDGEKQPVGRDRPKPFGLPGGTTPVIDVLDGQGTSQGAPGFDKLGGRQAGQWQPPLLVGLATPA